MNNHTPTVVVVETSPRADSVSSAASRAVAELLKVAGVTVIRAAQRELPFEPAGLDADAYPAALIDFVANVAAADAVVLAVPVHRAAVAGLARNLVEHLRDVLPGKIVLPLVAAGSERSTLAAQAFQADLLLNFDCRAMRAVLLSPGADSDEVNGRLTASVAQLCATLGTSVPTSRTRPP